MAKKQSTKRAWLYGPVPHGYWKDPAHRKDYFLWLGDQLGFKSAEDWYALKGADFKRHGGDGLFQGIYSGARLKALSDIFPEVEWIPWQFFQVGQNFWRDDGNVRQYLYWLERQLGYSKPEDWYAISIKDFKNNHGMGVLNRFHQTPSDAARFLYPTFGWLPWKFDRTPVGFWGKPKNRRRYMEWLGEQLGFKKAEDWYRISKNDFVEHHGAAMLQHFFANTPSQAVRSTYTETKWLPWLFHNVPKDYWQSAENRKAYVDWLGAQQGYKHWEDWYEISQKTIYKHHGSGILTGFFKGDPQAMVIDAYPQHEWLTWKFSKTSLHYWRSRKNRLNYLNWLKRQIGFEKPEDWYDLAIADLKRNYGAGLFANAYASSLRAVAKDYDPDYDWKPWLFRKVEKGFWDTAENCRDYMAWLERKLQIKHPDEWYEISSTSITKNHGSGFYKVACGHSMLVAVSYLYPDFPFEPERFSMGVKSQKRLMRLVNKLYSGYTVKWNYRHPRLRFAKSQYPMELDVFVWEMNLGFEYQGEQHFMPNPFYGGKDGLRILRERDEEKRRAAVRAGICLIEVPYWWDRSSDQLSHLIEGGPGECIPPDWVRHAMRF